ncbi:MAG: type II toxin-antitoxin system Phd/YefM family antitoxin [Ferrovum myxofaciens]|uniref:type II toxin-antitoxin system Phd/YefM family antitoxin n=1 Tax=Ferrovum myxofaciens TaxID=416213 RepID=UPI0023534772|nr:type II toxin-antitoxin system Phd/YefM family antitoxin [Ferrovum myxofaciens]QKE41691.1 MAG: type II toxin-antitoxin system Phd/YefM family antitoxin [Ferrovum myxofaciens]
MQTFTATEAKNNFGNLMSAVEKGSVSITRNGRAVAILVAVETGKAPMSEAEIKKLLTLYADGLMSRHDVQDESGLAFDEILERMALFGLTLPIVRTIDRYDASQKALYDEIFSHE